MQAPMDPVDQEICEADEEGELNKIVQSERGVGGRVIEFGVATDFAEEERRREDGHDGKGDEGLLDLETDLVLEVFWVCESCMVEHEDVG